MAQIQTWFNQDLQEAVKVRYIDGNVFSADNAGNIIGVNVFDGGEPASLTGSVSGLVIRADGATVAVVGTLSGNQVSVALPQSAYAVPGAISVVVKLTSGTTVTTLLAVVGVVYMSTTDTVVDPGTIIPDITTLIDEIEAVVASIPADYSDLWTSLAPAYSNSSTYNAGQYVTYNGKLYRCRTPITSSESWTSSHWSAVNIGNYLYYHEIDFAPQYSTSSTYAVGDYVTYLGRYWVCKTAITAAESWTGSHWTQTNVSSRLKLLENGKADYYTAQTSVDKSNNISGTIVDISGDFEQGGITVQGATNSATNRCRSNQYYPVNSVRYVFYSVPDGYKLNARCYDAKGVFVYSCLSNIPGIIELSDDAALCKFVISKEDDSDITPTGISGIDVDVSFKSVPESMDNELHQTVLQNFSLAGAYKYDGYLNSAYEIVENANHKTTDFIYLKAGDKFDYSLVASGWVFSVYDMTFTAVESVGVRSITTVVTGSYTMAADGYIRVTNRVVSYDGYVRFDVETPDIVKNLMAAVGSPMQDYFADEMEDTIAKVLALKTEPCITFPIVTDIHYKYNGTLPASQFDHTMDNVLYFLKKVKCDFVINLGDSSDGRAPLATQVEYCNAQSKKFAEISVPYYFVQGNHELNIYSGGGYSGTDELDAEQIYTLFFNCLPQGVTRNPDNYRDYYVDLPFNIRMIVLCMSNTTNNNAYKVGNSTVSWYRDTALDSNKTILLMTHYSPIANYNSYPTVYGDANITALKTITESFVSGGGTLINLYGHSHADFHFETPYLNVAFNCARCAQSDISIAAYDWLRANSDIVSPTRQLGTATEDSWTVCVLRPLSGKIDFIRFGAGSDRTGLSY